VVDLLKNFEPQIESVTLVPSDGGRYELTVNGKLLYSKLKTGRHAAPGEAVSLVKTFLEEGK
jgi:selenoprotein W-related protein